mgnify:CR=1 FL=1
MKKSIPLFLAFATIVSFAFVKPNSKAPKQINVVIDAGHGGSDSGATSSSSTEKQRTTCLMVCRISMCFGEVVLSHKGGICKGNEMR